MPLSNIPIVLLVPNGYKSENQNLVTAQKLFTPKSIVLI